MIPLTLTTPPTFLHTLSPPLTVPLPLPLLHRYHSHRRSKLLIPLLLPLLLLLPLTLPLPPTLLRTLPSPLTLPLTLPLLPLPPLTLTLQGGHSDQRHVVQETTVVQLSTRNIVEGGIYIHLQGGGGISAEHQTLGQDKKQHVKFGSSTRRGMNNL